jgi:two-component system, OmpR family, sensor kinase
VRRIPIRLRVAAAAAIAMAMVLVLTSSIVYVRLGSHLESALDDGLRLRAQDLTALAERPGASISAAGTGRLIEGGESYAEVLSPEGRVLDATAPLRKHRLLTARELRRAGREPLFTQRSSVPGLDEPSRLLATPITRDGSRAVLVVGATLDNRAETLASFRKELLIAGPIALALALLAGYGLAGLAFRPVELMRRRAAAISAETRGERLPVPPTRDEIQRLGETLNAMLGRLEDALQRERDFVADAGHELRTPLTLLRTELELALRQATSFDELHEAVRLSSEEVDRLTQLTEHLLLIARSDCGQLPLQLELLDAQELLATVASRFEWRAREAGRTLRATPNGHAAIRGDRLRIEQALANLVDNALRHGDGAVELAAREAEGTVELHVLDAGPGFAPESLERAFDRFTRFESGRPGAGTGLGLSIVKVIAEAHAGTAHVSNIPGGGADAWLVLPAARPLAPKPPGESASGLLG